MNAFEKHSNMDIYKMLSLMTLRKKNHFINDRMMKLSEVKCFGQRSQLASGKAWDLNILPTA